MKTYIARFKTKVAQAHVHFSTENEMYVCLECNGIVEENPDVIGINYYEIEHTEELSGYYDKSDIKILRSWDFGKPFVDDYWKLC